LCGRTPWKVGSNWCAPAPLHGIDYDRLLVELAADSEVVICVDACTAPPAAISAGCCTIRPPGG
jgi:hypothetical protein